MTLIPVGRTIAGVTHHRVALNGTELHYVAAGTTGSPILLVHGFPESWWTFHKLIPLLANKHRVFAVDLRGFGDSAADSIHYDSASAAEDLHQFIAHLGLGPVHLTGQDISGGAVYRLAAAHPKDIASLTAIEMGLAGFGLEGFADITHGGSWHIGVLAASDIPEMLLAGREQPFLDWSFKAMTARSGAITDTDIAEFARGYARANGWRGASGLYRAMLAEGAEFRALAQAGPLAMPILAIGAGGGAFTHATMTAVSADPVRSVLLEGVGHYAAMEAPVELSRALLDFVDSVDLA